MAKEKLTLHVEALNLSESTLEKLKLSGIGQLEDFNTFDLKELKSLLGDAFSEVVEVLAKYALPSQLGELNLNDETIEVLNNAGINDFKELLEFDRNELYHILENDKFNLQDVNDLLETYHQRTLDGKEEEVVLEEQVVEQTAEERFQKFVQPVDKGYGSRTFSHFKIRLASPDEIRQWSYGEVLTHETINYRTSKPEPGGLFCERIFGPTRDYQCSCGKKQTGNKGQICPKCGIEITESKVRRERMGHIELEAPVVHTWYLKNSPSRLAILLGIKAKALEEVVYHASYIVTDPGNTPLVKKQILSEQDYSALTEDYGNRFTALTGAEAVKKLLQELDLDKEVKSLRRRFKTASKQKRDAIIKRLEVVEAFNNSDNKPEWMVMDVIPVQPPDLRPMVPLDGGRFATTDINDLYRRILNRNNRLKKQKEQRAPRLITKNEKRMLQEAVDSLFDNAKRGKRAAVERNRHLKSLSDMLRGKQGRFRQNLLGKRVDYSGRSVIIVGPDLQMYQCGIPREMAVTLFKPFILRELQEMTGVDKRSANNRYEKMDDDVFRALEKVVREHPVLLNRAPTLHRLGIQAFEPKLIDGKAIRLHPLVTPAFNADFDGDQMAVHVPLSIEAQAEARLLMLASNNILDPKDGKPVVTPSQDMVLGNYYLTIEENRDRVLSGYDAENRTKQHAYKNRNEGKFFVDIAEAEMAYQNHEIELHTRIILKPQAVKQTFTKEQNSKYLVTTLGKLIFNRILPESFPYLNEPTQYNLEVQTPDIYFIDKGVNPEDVLKDIKTPEPFKKKFLSMIIAQVFKQFHISETSKMLDRLKDLGFKYSTIAGITISFADINVYSNKEALIAEVKEKIAGIEEWYEDGLLTDSERRNLVIQEWKDVRDKIQDGLMKEFDEDNNIFMMSDSGARGSASNFAQLAGMRGLMNNPKGDIIEVPVQASFREGLTVSEFFISTHGARKGSTDTALKTAESGYLTRRLVDVSQDVIIVEDDCGSHRGLVVSAIESDGKEIVPLYDRIFGRFASRDVIHPKTKTVIVARNELITDDIAAEIVESGLKSVEIRSVLTCNSEHGICAKDYGMNLATNKVVEVGEAVGVVAAQSIGEPGTQLTMRTFHTGGVASASDITQGLPRIQELFEARNPKGKAVITEVSGKVKSVERRGGSSIVTITDELNPDKEYKYTLDPNVESLVRKGASVKAGQKLSLGSIHPRELLRAGSAELAQQYILEEVQKVYRAQNVAISDKHIEVIIRQMLRRISVVYEGDTELLPGTEVSINEFKRANRKAISERKRLAVGRPILLGITRASLRSDSFLSAASFQETTRILTDAAIKGKVDELHGLKENVIIGGLIPAGTGILNAEHFEYDKPESFDSYDEDLD
ncbi:DNA-directed RNA polymerase subunit beta\' [Alteracholeplasma palmae J233]|uniref:DNA-directed RNA polymerase subunit beta' n=1 Tax=Alteracholeplasma palmae (strain ATCC 49389 / J233) TaxID=1318466 RepID=U4KLK9_ALTPJ|nr:DNA-directed RNA polymerase subunit beta' [Alteracholeplasma palmae]CCV64849.1 DNA-directed RNA polymerase subunit beta\' [Alteracholeplasma palmae J233]